MDVRKTVTDAGYIAIGLGVMGYQQTQIRRRELTTKLQAVPGKLGSVPANFGTVPAKLEERAREVQGFLTEGGRQISARGVAARGRAEDQVRATVSRVQDLGGEVAKLVEPVVEQVQSQLGDLPERVVQVIEPVAARVRERTGSAA
jgi:hypothetical protein